MKKTPGVIGAVVVGLAMLTLFAGSAPAAERPGFETYVVRRGDTLSKISGRIFGDAKRWREILKANPQVTNANRIFPGDTLLVPVPATAAPAARAGEGLSASAGADAKTPATGADSLRTEIVTALAAPGDQGAAAAPQPGPAVADGTKTPPPAPAPPVERVRPAATVHPTIYRAAGYISDKLPEIAITATEDERSAIGSSDTAIVNAPIPPGRRFTVVRADRRIFHPVTGRNLGWLIRIVGSAEVSCAGERTSTVTVATSNDIVGIGDYLVPIDPNDVLEKNVLAGKAQPRCISPGESAGVIVAFDEDRPAASERDFAYIDRGTAEGVTPGQVFTIYQEAAAEGSVMVGELQVLRAGLHTSTGLITTSIREIQVGYLLRAR